MNNNKNTIQRNLLKMMGLSPFFRYFLIISVFVFYASCIRQEPIKTFDKAEKQKKLFWGDLHNHNSIGYGKGSLERTFKIAQSHLDFFCFTPHSQWPDIPAMPNNAQLKWSDGFLVTKDNWESVKQYVKAYNQPGSFVSFLGYEWHSNYCGDLCIILPADTASLRYFKDVKGLQEYARKTGAILIPHHPAYKTGWRGQDWNVLDTGVSPVVEIYSEHGNAESDRSPVPYILHSMGGRYTPNTVQSLWKKGIKIGVVASSDDHLGFPGAYGEGIVGIYADTLTRESIIEAIKSRRTYGASADRIELDFRLNDHYMGSSIPQTDKRDIMVKVKGKDEVDRIEVLKNNRVIYRNFPADKIPGKNKWDKPVFCRIEFGWGPWSDLNMTNICDWHFTIQVTNGKILSSTPCFQSGPYTEDYFNQVSMEDGVCEVKSYTSRLQAFLQSATNSVILEVQGSPETELSITLYKPEQLVVHKTFSGLEKSSDIIFTGPFTSESLMVQRLVFYDNYYAMFNYIDKPSEKTNDWYYIRVIQSNGSMAWSSPVWVGE